MDARVGANHHNVTAFAKAIDELKAQSDYEETIAFEHVKLPFKVKHDFCTDDGPGWELQVYAHDDEELNELSQCYFVLSVELVSMVKPHYGKHIPKMVLCVINSPGARASFQQQSGDSRPHSSSNDQYMATF